MPYSEMYFEGSPGNTLTVYKLSAGVIFDLIIQYEDGSTYNERQNCQENQKTFDISNALSVNCRLYGQPGSAGATVKLKIT